MNGIQVEGYGTIKGTIICTSHDNLAAHMLFCMILGFRGRYCCRFCKITVDDSLMATKEEKELLRVNIENDIENAMDENGRVTDHHKSYGFTGKSELLKLNYFKIETGSSVDPFHDLLEGIVPRDLKHVFSYMIRNMKVSEQHIGDLIHAFKFGILSNSHKPANVKLAKDSQKLGLSAMQTLTLILNFKYIFGHLFVTPDDHAILNFVNNLKSAVCLSFKTTITENDIDKLDVCIEKHLSKLNILFPESTKSRKHHWWTHYPTVIRRLGPPGLMSTAAFEHKHIFFTRHIRKTTVNKNVIKTLAMRHQFVMATKLTEGCDDQLAFGKICQAQKDIREIWEKQLNLGPDDDIEDVSWVKLGYKYAPSYLFYRNDRLIEIQNIVKFGTHLFIKGKEYDKETDDGISFKLLGVKSEVYLSFNKLKFHKTYNKVMSTCDKSYHVTII